MKENLTYGSYLKIPELLDLQVRLSDPVHHDEMLFIVIHQSYELWFKLVLHELDVAKKQMESGQVLRARHFIQRCLEIFQVLTPKIHILETMSPQEFLGFRDKLNPASGFQSVQFREIEFVCGLKDDFLLKHFQKDPPSFERLQRRFDEPDLGEVYLGLLSRLGFAVPTERSVFLEESDLKTAALEDLRRVYDRCEEDLPLYLLSESLIELDECLSIFRYHHFRVVERLIGSKRGTGGSEGAAYLKTTLDKRCFPWLWEVRTVIRGTNRS